MYKLHHPWPCRSRGSKHDGCFPKDIKESWALRSNNFWYCRSQLTFHNFLPYLHSSSNSNIKRGYLCPGDRPPWPAFRSNSSNHTHAMEGAMSIQCADIVVNVVSSILDEFCCQVGNISSMWLSSVLLKLLNFLVGTAKPMLMSIRNRDAKWWYNCTPNPNCGGGNRTRGRVACIIACPIEATLIPAFFSAKNSSNSTLRVCGKGSRYQLPVTSGHHRESTLNGVFQWLWCLLW